jgi:hypothetical protein
LEKRVLANPYQDIQVPRRSTVGPCFAITSQAKGHSIINPSGNANFDFLLNRFDPGTGATFAWIGNRLTSAATSGTGSLYPEKTLALKNGPLAITLATFCFLAAWFTSRPRTIPTGFISGNLDGFGDSAGSLSKINQGFHLEVFTGVASLTPTSTASKEIVENIKNATLHSRAFAAASSIHSGVAIAIIPLAFFGITQNMVGFGNLAKTDFRFGVSRIPVRMPLHGKLAVGGFDSILIHAAFQLKNLVITALVCHLNGSANAEWS